jgi:hypothetical protein
VLHRAATLARRSVTRNKFREAARDTPGWGMAVGGILLSAFRVTEQVALGEFHADGEQGVRLFLALDAFCDRLPTRSPAMSGRASPTNSDPVR